MMDGRLRKLIPRAIALEEVAFKRDRLAEKRGVAQLKYERAGDGETRRRGDKGKMKWVGC